MLRKFWFLALFLLFCLPTAAQETTPSPFKTPQELADANGQFADIEGVSLYYVAHGEPENPAVILIHGFGGSTFTWRDNLQAIADAGFYALALDLPPFGLSDKNPDLDYSRSWMADMVAGLMDELNIETATIVGHSMGGSVTAQFAVRHPERVDKLVFVAGGIFDRATLENSEDDQEDTNSPFALLANLDPNSPFAATALRAILTPETFTNILISAYHRQEVVTDEVTAGYQRPLQIQNWTNGFLAYQQAEETAEISLADLTAATQTTPILIVWGKEDTWVTIQMGEAMNAALANVTFVTYAETGHLPMEENTEQFNEDMIAFLQS
jgi:pimeloyl-ACP methyl ester carboxylesterase